MTEPAKNPFVVSFGDEAAQEAGATVEFDDDYTGDFLPGDEFYFLVNLPVGVVVDTITTSSGTVNKIGKQTRERTQDQIQFLLDEPTMELSYHPTGQPAPFWYGNSPALTTVGKLVTADGKLPAIGDLAYSVDFVQYRFVPGAMPETVFNDDGDFFILIDVRVKTA